MKKILNHIVLAFIIGTQVTFLLGCSQHVKVFECEAQCDKTSLKCTTAVSGTELDIK